MSHLPHDPVTLDILQGNIDLLAEKERLELERRRLLELDRLRTEFLARVSHDLRTPLASILGFSELMLSDDDVPLPKRHGDLVQAIHRNGQQLLAMINDLLDLSTLESRQLQLRIDEVPLAALVEDVVLATGPVLAQAGLETTWPSAGDLAGQRLRCDRRRVVQVLVNLLDNARKFTPRGGRITVRVSNEPSHCRFTVADTGPGIPPESRDRLFRAMPTSLSAQPTRADGHGLGLAIVKAIVDNHGGHIDVDGGVGKGCIISFTIPNHPAP